MNVKERIDCRHDLGLVREALAYFDEHGNLEATARQYGLPYGATVRKWVVRRERLGGDWPTEEDVRIHRERNSDLAEERARRRVMNHRHRVRRYFAGGGSTRVPARGVGRRLRALAALGWTQKQMAEHSGWSKQRINHMIRDRYPRVSPETFARVARMYDDLSMIVPIDDLASLAPHAHPPHEWARRAARRAGWAPPLAWDDIDHDDQPAQAPKTPRRTEIDHAVVERVLAGERLPTTTAEKFEIMRRWLAQGRTENTLNKRMGWNTGRYLPGNDDLEESA